jgi:hypothetical protein
MSSEKAYLVESILRGRPSYSLCKTFDNALGSACCGLHIWAYGGSTRQPAPEHIKALLKQERHLESIQEWNSHFSDYQVRVHEIEIIKKECHHDPVVPPAADMYYLVERSYRELGVKHDLFTTLDGALRFATSFMAPRQPVKSPVQARRKARRLIAAGRLADAIDRWNRGQSDPTFAIHQVRIVRTNCQNEAHGCSLN